MLYAANLSFSSKFFHAGEPDREPGIGQDDEDEDDAGSESKVPRVRRVYPVIGSEQPRVGSSRGRGVYRGVEGPKRGA
jgi:hypothetical protein